MSDPLRDARHLILRAAPELCDAPLYVRPHDVALLPRDVLALTMPLDPLWRSRLEAEGRWHGVGRLVVLSDEMSSRPFEDVLGCVCHEVAHLLPAQVPSVILDGIGDMVALCREWEAVDAACEADTLPGSSANQHGADFVRRLLHLRHRVQQERDVVLPFNTLGVYHGPCHVSLMAKRLGDEPARLRDATFQEIEQITPPAAYAALWKTGE
jgi:hypothetical protein